MNVYIGYNAKDEPVGVLLAQNKQLADVVFDARNEGVVRTEEIDPNTPDIGLNGVVYLLTSFKVPRHQICDNKHLHSVRIWQRGK